MESKSFTRLALFGLGVIAVIGAVAVYLYLPTGQDTPKTPSQSNPVEITAAPAAPELNPTDQQANTEPTKTQLLPATFPVKDEYPVPQEIAENIFAEAQRAAELAAFREKHIKLKKNGLTMWRSKTWMKEPEYYQNLTTEKLVEECFEGTVFGHEMSIFNDSSYGFIRLEVHHNGFAELFKRDDMWEGILHTYYQCASKIDPQSDAVTIVKSCIQINGFVNLYSYPPFQKQLKEHELDFLTANIFVLKQALNYLENYDHKKYGLEPEEPLFYGEIFTSAQVALNLTKDVNPELYSQVGTEIEHYTWPHEQKNKYLKEYLLFVLDKLKPAYE